MAKLVNNDGQRIDIDASSVIVKIDDAEMTLADAITQGKIGQSLVVVNVLDSSGNVPSCEAVTNALDSVVSAVDAELATKQDTLIAGDGIEIASDGTISATGGGGGSSVTIDKTIPASPSDNHVPSTKLLKTSLDAKQNVLKAGSNIVISADGTISCTFAPGTAQSASQVAYTNGQTTTSGGTVADKLTELDSAIGGEYTNDFVVPKYLYLTQDSKVINDSRPLQLYIDHLINLQNYCKVTFKTTKSNVYHTLPPLTKISQNTSQSESIDVMGAKNVQSITLTKRIAPSTNGKDKLVRLLQIGDSVTASFGADANIVNNNPTASWAIAQKLFMIDALKDGSFGTKYRMQNIGTRTYKSISATYNGQSASGFAFSEGRGGWKLTDYLYREFTGETDEERNPIVGSSVLNPFYDEDKVWNDSELSANNVKFSLSKYLQRFRTYTDDGVKLLEGDANVGTNIIFNATDNPDNLVVSSAKYVNTPTHVIIQLGFNDSNQEQGFPSFVDNLRLITKAIHEEYPTMIIGISLIDAAGGYYVDKYSDEYSCLSWYNYLNTLSGKELHNRVFNWIKNVSDLCDTLTNVYFLPNFSIQPTIEACHSIKLDSANGKTSYILGTSGTYHPNNIAHSAWGQQIYSWLKWTI